MYFFYYFQKAIQYLLPSGVFQPAARPVMEPPQDFIEASKFDDTGRPYHFLFYTAKAKMFEIQHVSVIVPFQDYLIFLHFLFSVPVLFFLVILFKQETVVRLNKADKLLEQVHNKGHIPEQEDKM